jgi:hypothetical protein
MAARSLSLSDVGSYRRPSAASKLERLALTLWFRVLAVLKPMELAGHPDACLRCTLIVLRSLLERWRMSFSKNRSPFFRDMR